MELDKNKLLIKQLPPTIYIKNFIDGHPANYEDFLTTFINSSKLVTCKGNQAFILRKHEEQNHGEADIFNSFYDLDFKIMVDTKYMEARRMLSPTITEFCPGVVGKGPSRLKGERKVYDIIHFLRREMLDFTAFPVFFVSNLLLVQRKKYYFNRATVSRNCSIVL